MIKITNQTDFTTKYVIESKFSIKGVVEKSDIVGAIFGQRQRFDAPYRRNRLNRRTSFRS